MESRFARFMIKAGTGLTLAFLYIPLAVVVIYAFNDSVGQAWPIARLHAEVVRHRVAQPERAGGAVRTRSEVATIATLMALAARERAPRSPSTGSGSSGATPCRSCSCCRSRSRGS